MSEHPERPEHDELFRLSHRIAEAIAARDIETLRAFLAPDFMQRAPGGSGNTAEPFLQAIRDIPGEIVFVRLELVRIDMAGEAGVASGIQHARVRIDGQDIDDRRAFVDVFARIGGEWRLCVAIDVPPA